MCLIDFKDKYITDHGYIRKAQKLRDDLTFLSTLVDRNTTCDFDFEVVPTKHGNITGSFLKMLWGRSYIKDEQALQKLIIVYEISLKVIGNLDWHDLDLTEFLAWAEVLEYHYNIDFTEDYHMLINGNWQCEAIEKVLNG